MRGLLDHGPEINIEETREAKDDNNIENLR